MDPEEVVVTREMLDAGHAVLDGVELTDEDRNRVRIALVLIYQAMEAAKVAAA